jgi:hypothetical protein
MSNPFQKEIETLPQLAVSWVNRALYSSKFQLPAKIFQNFVYCVFVKICRIIRPSKPLQHFFSFRMFFICYYFQ